MAVQSIGGNDQYANTISYQAQNTAKSGSEAGNGTQDSVKISSYAQAKALKEEGESNSTIAAMLGLNVKTVDSYFNTGTTTAMPIMPAGGGVQGASSKTSVPSGSETATDAQKAGTKAAATK